MLDLRNMPYVTGRILSWSNDLEPVASAELKRFMQVNDGMLTYVHPGSFVLGRLDYGSVNLRVYLFLNYYIFYLNGIWTIKTVEMHKSKKTIYKCCTWKQNNLCLLFQESFFIIKMHLHFDIIFIKNRRQNVIVSSVRADLQLVH